MRHQQFRLFLTEQGQTDPSPEELCRCAAEIEALLGSNLDNADLGHAEAARLLEKLDPSPDSATRPLALEAYRQFTAYFRAR